MPAIKAVPSIMQPENHAIHDFPFPFLCVGQTKLGIFGERSASSSRFIYTMGVPLGPCICKANGLFVSTQPRMCLFFRFRREPAGGIFLFKNGVHDRHRNEEINKTLSPHSCLMISYPSSIGCVRQTNGFCMDPTWAAMSGYSNDT